MKKVCFNSKVRLDLFNPKSGLVRGRSKIIEIIWYLVKMVFFLTAFPWPSKFKCIILRIFGAKVGRGVIIKPRVNIHFPWKLILGNNVWIGEEVFILNFEPITIGSNVCISQRVFLCGGNHDYRDIKFSYRNDKIIVEDGVWIGASSFIAAGVTISQDAVITAGSVATKDQPQGMICSGNPCIPLRPRWTISNSD